MSHCTPIHLIIPWHACLNLDTGGYSNSKVARECRPATRCIILCVHVRVYISMCTCSILRVCVCACACICVVSCLATQVREVHTQEGRLVHLQRTTKQLLRARSFFHCI